MKNLKYFLVLMMLPGLLISCGSFMEPSDPSNGTVTILLSPPKEDGTDGAGARAAIPDALIDTLHYTLEFRGPKNQAINRDVEPGAGAVRLSLALGAWTINARAYTPDNYEMGAGSITVTVTPGEGSIIIPMTAYPASKTFGITVPADITINGVPASGSITPLSRLSSDTLSITLTDTYTSIAWYLDDAVQTETGATFVRSAGDLQVRQHTLMVMTVKDGLPYSATITFDVVP
jgi:hypothetical protein